MTDTETDRQEESQREADTEHGAQAQTQSVQRGEWIQNRYETDRQEESQREADTERGAQAQTQSDQRGEWIQRPSQSRLFFSDTPREKNCSHEQIQPILGSFLDLDGEETGRGRGKAKGRQGEEREVK